MTMTEALANLSYVPVPTQPRNLVPGESVHIGYQPMTEEEAFADNTPEQEYLTFKTFLVPRGNMTIDRIIDHIRQVSKNNLIDTIISPRSSEYTPTKKCMYDAEFMFMNEIEQTWVKIRVELRADRPRNSIAVDITRLRGDARLCKAYSETLEKYVKSDGQESSIVSCVNIPSWIQGPSQPHAEYLYAHT